MADLPPVPRTVIPPEVSPVVKRNLPLRAVLIPVLLLGLVVGGVGLLKLTAGPTPDERATELATKLAPAILAVYTTQDPAVVAQAVAIRTSWEKDTGCRVLGGAVVPGSTRENATRSAEALIASAKKAGQFPEGTGSGYAVVSTNGEVPRVKWMSVVVAVSCVAPSPSPAFGVGS